MKKLLFCMITLFSITILSQDTIVDYYPIHLGSEWKYKMPERSWEETFIVTKYDSNNNAFIIKHIISLNNTPMTYEILLQKENGIVRSLGTKNLLLDTDWQMKPFIILKSYPEVGQTWNNKKYRDKIEHVEVLGFTDMTVVAGTFKNVLILQKSYSTDDSKAEQKPVLIKDYYAPNIGLIKIETFNLDTNENETFLELINYQK